MSLIELPYGLPGRVFASPMPYSSYDPSGSLLEGYLKEEVKAIILLAEDQECQEITQRDLKKFYTGWGFQVIHLPIKDFTVPKQDELKQAVRVARELAGEGKDLVIHCHAGLGRTGLFAACLAREVLGFSGEEAIIWVRERIPHAVENQEQRNLVLHFQSGEA